MPTRSIHGQCGSSGLATARSFTRPSAGRRASPRSSTAGAAARTASEPPALGPPLPPDLELVRRRRPFDVPGLIGGDHAEQVLALPHLGPERAPAGLLPTVERAGELRGLGRSEDEL